MAIGCNKPSGSEAPPCHPDWEISLINVPKQSKGRHRVRVHLISVIDTCESPTKYKSRYSTVAHSSVRASTFCVCVRMVPNESDTKEGCARIWGSRSCSVFLSSQQLVSDEPVSWYGLQGSFSLSFREGF